MRSVSPDSDDSTRGIAPMAVITEVTNSTICVEMSLVMIEVIARFPSRRRSAPRPPASSDRSAGGRGGVITGAPMMRLVTYCWPMPSRLLTSQ